MIYLKILVLQFFWFGAVKFSGHSYSFFFWILAVVLLALNYTFYKIEISKIRYVFFILFFSLWGALQDGVLDSSGAVKFANNTLWLNSLWLIFLAYYGDVLNKFTKLNTLLQAVIGGVAGVLTYWSGCQLANVQIENQLAFFIIVFISWFVFFPLTLNLFYKKSFWNWILDRSVYFSFDGSGFVRHAESFEPDDNISLEGKHILVTGGTGGIGLSACEGLNSLGAQVLFTGRNGERGQKYSKDNCVFVKLDMVNWSEIEQFTRTCDSFDGVVLNAGGMPGKVETNEQGVEHQAASQLFGHFFLLKLLLQKKKLNKGCRITWVSSGGMYLKKLDLSNLVLPENYDKVDTYANVKRAQITLVEELAKDKKWKDYIITAMHPGWVATDAVKDAIPSFYNFTKGRLRTPKQGADTIVWLQLSKFQINSGDFYFDRKKVSPYISKNYIPSEDDREKLISLLQSYIIGGEFV